MVYANTLFPNFKSSSHLHWMSYNREVIYRGYECITIDLPVWNMHSEVFPVVLKKQIHLLSIARQGNISQAEGIYKSFPQKPTWIQWLTGASTCLASFLGVSTNMNSGSGPQKTVLTITSLLLEKRKETFSLGRQSNVSSISKINCFYFCFWSIN